MNRNDMNRFTNAATTLDIGRSIIPKNFNHTFTFNLGECIPFFVDDGIMPGDTVSIDTSKVVRVQPLVTPVFGNIVLDCYWFFVPYRLVWSHWKNFMGESDKAWTPSVEYTVPKLTIPSGGFNAGTIADHMGIPINVGDGTNINALPFRCYALIMSEWFRDQNLMDPCQVSVDETTLTGVNTDDQVTDIQKGGKPFLACKLHDLFTSALPAPQKGPSVSFSLAGEAPVYSYNDKDALTNGVHAGLSQLKFKAIDTSTHTVSNTANQAQNVGLTSPGGLYTTLTAPSGTTGTALIPSNLWTDLQNVSQFSINELRMAFAIQRYYEALSRSGSRYIEQILAFYGVHSPDARMQRPEYLGGNRVPINIQQVENVTNSSTNVEPIGSVAGMSVTGDVNSDFTKSFTEHGCLMGICVARIDRHSYQQGLNKMWKRNTIFSYYNPKFANIGEQPIDSDEIYLTSSSTAKYTFGYQEAWYEYRNMPNLISGEFRSNYTTSLDMWHLADDYSSAPHLSASWIREDKSILDRALAVTSSVSNQFLADFYVKASYSRPMPVYSIPGLIDHH